jgi:hypothetical protein
LRKKSLCEIIEKIIEVDAGLVFRSLINAKVSFPSSIVSYFLEHSKDLKLSKI